MAAGALFVIFIGCDAAAKNVEVARYCRANDVQKVFVLSPSKFAQRWDFDRVEAIEYAEIIQYKFFYRLLQEIDGKVLVVVNECLRTQNRYDLTYNCIRNFLNQTTHQLVFQRLPLIDTIDDFMVLFDFDTRSRWKRERFDHDLVRREARVEVRAGPPSFVAIDVLTDEKTRADYAREKRKLIDGLGLKDPHTIPRNLYLMSGKAKLSRVRDGVAHVGRNDRFKIDRFATFRDESFAASPYRVFELPHNFVDYADFMSLSGQAQADVLVADLKVDRWYFNRYQAWAGRVRDAIAAIHR